MQWPQKIKPDPTSARWREGVGEGPLPAIAANGAWAIAVPLQHTAINNLTSLIWKTFKGN